MNNVTLYLNTLNGLNMLCHDASNNLLVLGHDFLDSAALVTHLGAEPDCSSGDSSLFLPGGTMVSLELWVSGHHLPPWTYLKLFPRRLGTLKQDVSLPHQQHQLWHGKLDSLLSGSFSPRQRTSLNTS